MRAGEYRNYGEIQQPAETFDANGELITTYIHFAYAWASIEPLIGREYWSARQTVAETTGKIRLRYIPGLANAKENKKMIYVYGNKTYDIEAVIDPENKHIELVLLVKES